MYRIRDKKVLTQAADRRIVQFTLEAPLIAAKALAGQFVVLMVHEAGERFPLTVVATDIASGTLTVIVQEAGLTTKLLGSLSAGDSLYALVGPLGHATPIKNYGKVILVGGGVGIAEIYPVAKALKSAANHVTAIIGAQTKTMLILEEDLKRVCDELHITTDDGSYGRKGFVTDILKELLAQSPAPNPYSLVYAVGPIPMMMNVAAVTKPAGIKTLVSLNALMVDATGMCGSCRVTVNGKVRFACVDGPEFDAQAIDWKEFEQRNRIYEDKEKHICKLKTRITTN